MAYATIVIMAVILISALAAPQNPTLETKPSSVIPPEDLTYIIKIRNGEPTTRPRNLSPCARAILGCCKGNVMNSQCSENLNCGAFFFDVNPCDESYIEGALQAARKFYEQFDKVMA